jgi:hypothetical protein
LLAYKMLLGLRNFGFPTWLDKLLLKYLYWHIFLFTLKMIKYIYIYISSSVYTNIINNILNFIHVKYITCEIYNMLHQFEEFFL